MNLLITGGAGFVGSNLARTLQERHRDANLLIVDDFRVGTFANLSGEGPTGWTYRGNVVAAPLHELDLAGLLDDFAPDVVYHEASITDTTVTDEATMIRDNVEPFQELVSECVSRGIKLVWASSAATYGTTANGATPDRRPFRLDDAGRPANVYGFSKWVMENIHRRAQAANPDAHLVGLRYFNVFGPGEQAKGKMASMIYQLAQQIMRGRRPRLFAPGDQARDHIYVEDVVGCTIAAGADGATPGIYNCGTGTATTFNEIVDALNAALGVDLQPEYFDNPYAFYQDYTCADLTETTRGLNWTPDYATTNAIAEYVAALR